MAAMKRLLEEAGIKPPSDVVDVVDVVDVADVDVDVDVDVFGTFDDALLNTNNKSENCLLNQTTILIPN